MVPHEVVKIRGSKPKFEGRSKGRKAEINESVVGHLSIRVLLAASIIKCRLNAGKLAWEFTGKL